VQVFDVTKRSAGCGFEVVEVVHGRGTGVRLLDYLAVRLLG